MGYTDNSSWIQQRYVVELYVRKIVRINIYDTDNVRLVRLASDY